ALTSISTDPVPLSRPRISHCDFSWLAAVAVKLDSDEGPAMVTSAPGGVVNFSSDMGPRNDLIEIVAVVWTDVSLTWTRMSPSAVVRESAGFETMGPSQ